MPLSRGYYVEHLCVVTGHAKILHKLLMGADLGQRTGERICMIASLPNGQPDFKAHIRCNHRFYVTMECIRFNP